MNKLVLKTIAITLVSFVIAFVVAFGALWIFAPKVLAGVFSDTGNYQACVYFYERQYLKSSDLDDLSTLINKLDQDKDGVKLEQYSSEMIFAGGFKDYCKRKDDGKQLLVTTQEYFSGIYATSLIHNQKVDEGLKFCKEYATSSGYTLNNPYRSIIADNYDNATVLSVIKSALESLVTEQAFTSEESALILSDINQITNVLQ